MHSATAIPTLVTDRLVLRAPSLDDEQAVYEISRHHAVADNTCSIPHPYPRDEAERFLRRAIASIENFVSCVWMVCEKASPERAVGVNGYKVDSCFNHAEIGYTIHPEYWGNGYATESTRAIIDFAFTGTDLHRVWAGYFPQNPASGRVLEKCGMTREGCQKDHVLRFGTYRDLVLMGLTRQQWQAQR